MRVRREAPEASATRTAANAFAPSAPPLLLEEEGEREGVAVEGGPDVAEERTPFTLSASALASHPAARSALRDDKNA